MVKENPKKYWFAKKTYGWGWTPVTWQGWATVVIYVLLVTLFSFMINEEASNLENELIFKSLIPIAVLTALLIYISYKKGEKPGWQWGKKDSSNGENK